MEKSNIKTDARLIALAAALAAAIFILDTALPLGVAGGVPYVVVVLVSMWSPRREFTIIMAITGTVLTMAGFFISPAGGEMWKVLFNRFLALFAIWVTAVLVLYYKRAEAEIRESADSLAKAQEIANVGNWNLDIASKKIKWSDQLYRICGFRPKEISPTLHAFQNLVHPDDRDRVNNAIEMALKKEKPYDTQFRIVRKDGSERVIHSRGEVEFDKKGGPVRLFGVASDITVRKKAEEALRLAMGRLAKANKEIKSFTSMLSHDLRTPLVNMKGFSGELKSSFETLKGILDEVSPGLTQEQNRLAGEVLKEEMPEAFGFIDSSANSMEKLVSGIMALARIGERKLDYTGIDIDRLIDEKLKSMHHQIRERNVEVNVNSLPSVVADEMCMEQIFGNLLSNAINYMDADRPGLISISGEKREADTLFKVEDNGIGIPDYARKEVFGIFRRGAGKGIPGEGMGLAYVKALVERHDGEIWFETREGKWTIFFFTIPDKINI